MSRLRHPSLTTLLLCTAAIAIGYLTITTTRYFAHNYQLHGQEAQLRDDLQRLDSDHQQLTGIRDYLNSDQYVEEVARKVLGLVHPGETLVVVSSAAGATATPAAEPSPGEAWWKQLFLPPTPASSNRP